MSQINIICLPEEEFSLFQYITLEKGNVWDNTFICSSTKNKLSCFLEHTNLIYVLWYVDWICLGLRVNYGDFDIFNLGCYVLWDNILC